MPYKITWHTQGVYWRYDGVLTGNELLHSNFDIFGDERFDDIRYQIVDLRGVEKVEVDEKHMLKVAHLDIAASRSNPRIKVAVVAATEEAAKLSELYEEFSAGKSPWKTKLFSSLEEAEAWAIQPD